jgi:nucleoside-diphosphate-sugar epimerase
VTGLVRSGSAPAAGGVRPFVGDLAEPGRVAAEAARADATIHTAFRWAPEGPGLDAAFVEAALAALAGTGKMFLYTSGTWVMGNTEPGADEASPLAPPPAVAWRTPVERKVIEAAGRGVHSVVIRPARVYGQGGKCFTGFYTSARDTGAALVAGTGENHWSFVHVDDLADLYVRALGAEAGSVFIAASGPALKVIDIARAVSRAAGAEGRTQTMPVEEAVRVFGPVAEALILDQQVSGRKAEIVLGWRPKATPVMDAIEHGVT